MGITVLLLCSLPIWKVNQKSEEGEQETSIIGIKGALKIKGVPHLLIGFFGNCAVESTTMLWASSYLVGTRNFTEERAAAFASLFFIGMTAGRFISGLVSEKFSDSRRIQIGTGIALIAVSYTHLPISVAVKSVCSSKS